jgi:hypothetical protein
VKAFALLLACATATSVLGGVPKGYSIVPKSTSPDGKLAVTASPDDDTKPNQLVDVATGKVVATLVSTPAPLHDSHADFEPRWSTDGSLLEWYVDGKWGSWALVLVRVDRGAVTSQIDVRELAVHEVLAEVQRTHRDAAAAAKREGAQSGSWFRDGLAIDVKPVGTKVRDDRLDVPKPALPLELEVTYTSNPKQLDEYPKAAKLDGVLALAIDAQGKLTRR